MKRLIKRSVVWVLALALIVTTGVPAWASTDNTDVSEPEAATEPGVAALLFSEQVTTDEGAAVEEEEAMAPDLSGPIGDGGYQETGWVEMDGQTFYIDPYTEEMATGVTKIDGTYYCFDQYGVLTAGWMTMYGCKWHADQNGVVQTGLKTINGSKYYFCKSDDNFWIDDDTCISSYGIMYDCGITKNYVVAYNGRLFKIPNKKKDKKCKKIAKIIAKCSGKNCSSMKDLEKVQRAAYTVGAFYARCKYSMKAKYYNKPYGVFYAKKCSCAGTTRAMGLVLKYMGFKWKHVNENKYKHQWCSLRMDGKKGWADGMIGMAEYGRHPYNN